MVLLLLRNPFLCRPFSLYPNTFNKFAASKLVSDRPHMHGYTRKMEA